MTGVSSGARLREVRHQFRQGAGIEHGAGKLVRADFAALFEDVDAFRGKLGFGARFVVLADQSSQMQGAGKSGRPGADDQHVRVQPLAFGAHAAILATKVLRPRNATFFRGLR